MNINNLNENNDKEKEAVENMTQELLEQVAIKIKAESTLKKLDKESGELIKILENFSKKVPIMINRMEVINKELELDRFKETLERIEINSKSSSDLISNYKEASRDFFSYLKEDMYHYLKNRNFFTTLVETLVVVFIASIIIINLIVFFFYREDRNKVNYKLYEMSEVLKGEQKYWIDKNNYEIYIKSKKTEDK